MTRIRSVPRVVVAFVPIVLALVILTAALGFGRKLPERIDPPPSGAPAEIGVAYRAEAVCMFPIELGGLWWAFPGNAVEPPPAFGIWDPVGYPYPVRGVLILSSRNRAIFRADSDGSEFVMTAYAESAGGVPGCL